MSKPLGTHTGASGLTRGLEVKFQNTLLPCSIQQKTGGATQETQNHRKSDESSPGCQHAGRTTSHSQRNRLPGNELHASCRKKCRKFCNSTITYSPEASIWIKRSQFYRTLLRFNSGKGSNRVSRKQLDDARSPVLSVLPWKKSASACRNASAKENPPLEQTTRCGKGERRQGSRAWNPPDHLREKEQNFWRRLTLNWALGKWRGANVSTVQVQDVVGDLPELTTKEEVQDGI